MVIILNRYTIVQNQPWHKAVRLLSLWTQLHGGLNSEDYSAFCRRLIHSYGASTMLPLISRLKRCGLLYRKGESTPKFIWKSIRRDLNITAEENQDKDSEQNSDYHFVHSYCGYAPLSVRLLEKRMRDRSWTSINSMMDQEETSFNRKVGMEAEKGATLVVFVGGVTRSEVAAIRFLNSRHPESSYLICGSFITGSTLLQSMRMLSPA